MINTTYTTRIAETKFELEEVCRLNHQTFSEELEQHQKRENGMLIDKFHAENRYITCWKGDELVGMAAVRDVRPFSLDSKIENLDSYLPTFDTIVEMRLFAVKPEYRRTRVVFLVLNAMVFELVKKKYDMAVISGILEQQELYAKFGFVPFGPILGTDRAKFQPMYLSWTNLSKSKHLSILPYLLINLSPGPVDIKPNIAAEYEKYPRHHRSDAFIKKYDLICSSISKMMNVKNTQIFTGSGTLANEVILAHISTLNLDGAILSNGEFGNRLILQAKRFQLKFSEYIIPLSQEFDLNKIEDFLSKNKNIKWLYFTHCETSIGILNDLKAIADICQKKNILVFVDCISTFGIIPTDLSKIYMASASSGKAIGTYSGLGMVFYNDIIESNTEKLPMYLDITYYIKNKGIPYTINSNIVYSLGVAVNNIKDINEKFNRTKELTLILKQNLKLILPNFKFIEAKLLHCAIITVECPNYETVLKIGNALYNENIFINYNSGYLKESKTFQICLFSDNTQKDIENTTRVFKDIVTKLQINNA